MWLSQNPRLRRGATDAIGPWWSDQPSRTHRVFGCEFQMTHLGKSEGNYIRLRPYGPFLGLPPKR